MQDAADPMRSTNNGLQNTNQNAVLQNKHLSNRVDAAIQLRFADIELQSTIDLKHTTVEHVAWMLQFPCAKCLNTRETQ